MLPRSIIMMSASFLFVVSLTASVDAARPKLVRDQCQNEGMSGGGEGLSCPTEDHLLVRAKWGVFGTCEWRCCPPNGDGTYDCTKGTAPTRLGSTKFQNVIGTDQVLTVDPQTAPTTPSTKVMPSTKAPITRRGVEPGPPEDLSRVTSEGAQPNEDPTPDDPKP
jgi:hypothetical protein